VLLDGGDNASTTFRGHRPFKIWECKKRTKFSTFNDNFRVWAQISLNCIGISTSGKRRYQIQLIPRWTKKNCVNCSRLTSEITRLMFTHPNQIFRKAIFWPLGVLRPQIFAGARKWPSLTSAPLIGDGGLFYIFFKKWWKIDLKCSVLAARTLEPGE